VSTLRGEKPIYGPLSKHYTGMVALRAGLPVITIFGDFAGCKITFFKVEQ